MKPVDYRNETWSQVRDRVSDLRAAVYNHLATWGPCTTRELAEKCGIDLLTVRPRMTELYQLGLVDVVECDNAGGEGVYEVIPWDVAEAKFNRIKAETIERQMSLL